MTRHGAIAEIAQAVGGGAHVILTAPLGAGKSHALREAQKRLVTTATPPIVLDLFLCASTPEALTEALLAAIASVDRRAAEALTTVEAGLRPSARLLALLSTLHTEPLREPWLVDEVTEIRSLAYFENLADIEKPFGQMLTAARGALLTSSYPRLARTLFGQVLEEGETWKWNTLPTLGEEEIPGLTEDVASLTGGLAAPTLELAALMRDHDSLVQALLAGLSPGAALEAQCRQNYETLLLRSRGYAVSKVAAQAVAAHPGARLTDLFPFMGRTPGACRQYLQWLVEVGLLVQEKKRYSFASPLMALWGAIYLSSPQKRPTEIRETVIDFVRARSNSAGDDPANKKETAAHQAPPSRDRIEEIL